MGALRRLFGLLLLLIFVGVIGATVAYVKTLSELPEMETSDQVAARVGDSVQAQRAAAANGARDARIAPFRVVPPALLGSRLARTFLVARGCPGYLAAPVPTALDFWQSVLAGRGSSGCAAAMAEELADRLRPAGSFERHVAADRIRVRLGREGLFALWLSALPFTPGGPQGVAEASERLFHVPPAMLAWGQSAELVLAATHWDEAASCENPPLLRARRDGLLRGVAEVEPAQRAAILAEMQEPVFCARPAGS